MPSTPRILTINTGSSSLKTGIYDVNDRPVRLAGATVDGIGSPSAQLEMVGLDGRAQSAAPSNLATHDAALQAALAALETRVPLGSCRAVGHRIVHGGTRDAPELATDEALTAIRQFIPVAPLHLPQALAAVEVIRARYPDLPAVLCFDTAFHRTMPTVAQQYAIPRRWATGIRRYGFHGLSCEFIKQALELRDPERAHARVIIAHLGSGSSMTALVAGHSVETTMGFSPAGGLVMGTRPGDLDPGVLLALAAEVTDPGALARLLYEESGLLGCSGRSADMRDLLTAEATDPAAADAVALYCYSAKQALGRLVAVLGGLDVLVFTGGIGEHAAPVRARICEGLTCFGLAVDPARNAAQHDVISPDQNAVAIYVIATDEDQIIAGHTARVIAEPNHGRV